LARLEEEGRLEAEIDGLTDSIDSGVLLLDTGEISGWQRPLGTKSWNGARGLVGLGSIDALIDKPGGALQTPGRSGGRWREYVRRWDEARWTNSNWCSHP